MNHCLRKRVSTVVPQRSQWFIKTTHYAQEMLDALDGLDWSERTKLAQRNWIGRSEGALIDFRLRGCARDTVTVFTTRPDTLFGATFLVIGADHPQLAEFVRADRSAAVEEWRASLLPADAEPDFSVGIDLGTPVVEAVGAEAKSRFTGKIPKVTVEIRDVDPRAEAAVKSAWAEVRYKTE